ncbi:hypothetical protein BEWA_040080 [Theileria equi strain WA]|uniref:Uncharacterized protein n=1 Tax=Theileria equi strain WA TaxID=1537102 RepID=L1LFE1_THEEQ|nr:hypothetical protein BEWA_040080 [Theileria equi strain WA]EKX73970.1 hypothetical protein BEWA_040080 [Theileria equi strain WA]|eukprot:XP_004833422.1 hypothetical protein BEWA_040080 [Theileria equi strain WA]
MGIKHSVIDIAKDAKNNAPTTYYGNGISLTRKDEPEIRTSYGRNEKQPLQNYKQYRHKLPESGGWSPTSYELRAVNHGNNKQEGLETKGKFERYREVSVLYWLCDEQNSFPLIIGLGEGKPIYFKRENETTNEWEYSNIVPPANLSDYQRVLNQLNENFKNVVIVNLNADKDKKYCGHPSLNCFKSPTESSDSNCSHNGTTFVIVTVSDCIDTKIPSGFKCLKHSPSGNKMRVLGTYHGNSMISFKESVVATEYRYVNAYYVAGHINAKPLLLELSNGVDQGTSMLCTLTNNKWVPSNLSKNDLTQVLDQENCLRNSIVMANVSNDETYFCKCGNNHREIHVKKHNENLPVGSELYEHTLESTGGRETPEPSFNGHRLMDDIKDVTLPESPVTDVKKIYVYLCKSNTNMQLLIYMDNGSEPGKWLEKIYGGNTWTEANSVSLSGAKPTDSSSKEKIGKGLHEVCKKLKTGGCGYANSATTSTTVHGSSQSGGSSRSTDRDEGSNSSDENSSSNTLPSSSQPGARGPNEPDRRETGANGIDDRDGEGALYYCWSKKLCSEAQDKSKVASGGASDSTDKKDPFQKVIEFINDHHNEIAPSVGGVLGTGILGLAVWKAPAIFSRVLAICITSV